MFTSAPTFSHFTKKAQLAGQDDILCLQGNSVILSGKKYQTDAKDSAINRKTWQAFEYALKRAFSKRRLNEICTRYGFDLYELKNSGKPLDQRTVEVFGVGAATVSEKDLNEGLSWYSNSLRRQTVQKIRELVDLSSQDTYLGHFQDPKLIHGAPLDNYENFVNDRYRKDLQRCRLFQGVRELVSNDSRVPRLHPYYQRLAVSMVGHFETEEGKNDVGLIIPAPGDEKSLDYYKVHKIVSYGGLTAIALVPVSDESSLRPLLVFRGTKTALTQEGAVESWKNDMEPNLGESGYEASKKALADLMQDPKFLRGKKIDVVAFSLGGAHATRFMEDHKHWKEVNDFIGFNIVGTDTAIVDSLSRQINEMKDNWVGPNIYLHRNVSRADGMEGDWVNFVGKKHIGQGIKNPRSQVNIYEWLIDDLPCPTKENAKTPWYYVTFWGEIHSRRSMEKWKRRYGLKVYEGPIQCDPILNTYMRDKTVEDARLSLGSNVAYPAIYWIYSTLDFIFRLFGISFFRKNS